MSEKLEKQWVISRRPYGDDEDADQPFRPWKVFDSRAEARRFAEAKVARSSKWLYALDQVTRGPRA